jgi:hypothetical protein
MAKVDVSASVKPGDAGRLVVSLLDESGKPPYVVAHFFSVRAMAIAQLKDSPYEDLVVDVPVTGIEGIGDAFSPTSPAFAGFFQLKLGSVAIPGGTGQVGQHPAADLGPCLLLVRVEEKQERGHPLPQDPYSGQTIVLRTD